MGVVGWALKFPLSLLFAIFAGRGGLAVVDGTLSRMHPPGGASSSAGAILSPSSIAESGAHLVVIQQWREWVNDFAAAQGDRVLSPFGLLVIYLVVDILLIAVPVALLLWSVNRFAHGRITRSTATAAQAATFETVIRMAITMAVLFLIADIVEDSLLVWFLYAESSSTNLLVGIGVVSAAKWITLLIAVIATAIGLFSSLRVTVPDDPGLLTGLGQWWRVVLALRIHIAIGVFLLVLAGLQGDLGRQLDDAYLLLYDPWWRLAVTIATAVLLTFVLRWTGRLCLRAYIETPTAPPNTQLINTVILAGGLGLAVIGGAAMYFGWPVGQALLIPGVIVVLIAVFSFTEVTDVATVLPPMNMPEVAATETIQAVKGRRLASVLSTTPLAVLIALSLRNGIRLLTIRDVGGALWIGLVMLGSIAIAGVIAYRWTDLPATEPSRRWLPVLGLSSIVLFVVLGGSPQGTGDALAPWAAVFAFALALALGLTTLLLLGDSFYPGNVIAACGIKRLPVIGIAVVCFLATAAIDDQSVYHSTRLIPSASANPQNRMALIDALDAWVTKQPNKPEIPLVFVASSGGGIRAAYWTTLVLGCLIREDQQYERPPRLADDAQCRDAAMPRQSIFLASGISGGSLGLAVTQALDNRNDWWKPLRRDFLGPTIAAMAFRDIPNALLRINIHDQDRAAALERSWEIAVRQSDGDLGAGFMASARPDGKNPAFPLLMLNGTSVTDGCRLSVSALNLASPRDTAGSNAADTTTRDCLALDPLLPKSADVILQTLAGTKDGFDNTCRKDGGASPQDLRLSTAALLSARFPYVSPTGTLNSCQNPNDRTFDLDGGLIDSSGASPLALSWPEIVNWLDKHSGGRCFAPKLILIENGYLSQTKSQPPARPGELSAPLDATGAVRNAQSPAARQAAALAFQKSFPPGGCGGDDNRPGADGWIAPNVVDFFPVARPGIEAPLGWTLSKYSQESLEQQLGNPDNLCSAAVVRAWFTGETGKPPACH
jgi:hypothetical protein